MGYISVWAQRCIRAITPSLSSMRPTPSISQKKKEAVHIISVFDQVLYMYQSAPLSKPGRLVHLS